LQQYKQFLFKLLALDYQDYMLQKNEVYSGPTSNWLDFDHLYTWS